MSPPSLLSTTREENKTRPKKKVKYLVRFFPNYPTTYPSVYLYVYHFYLSVFPVSNLSIYLFPKYLSIMSICLFFQTIHLFVHQSISTNYLSIYISKLSIYLSISTNYKITCPSVYPVFLN